MTIKLAIRLFNDSESTHLELLVKHLTRRGDIDCELVDLREANALVVSPLDPGFDALYQRYRGGKEKIPVVYHVNRDFGGTFQLHRPATGQNLVALCKRLRLALGEGGSPRSSAANAMGTGGISLPPFLARLRAAAATQPRVSAGLADVKPVYVDFEREAAWVQFGDISGGQVSRNFSRLINSHEPLLLSAFDRNFIDRQLVNTSYHRIPLRTLLWVAAVHSSEQGAVDDDTAFRLAGWPDFSELPHHYAQVKLAAYLVKYPATVRQLAAATGTELSATRAFLVAAAACDLLRQETLPAGAANVTRPSGNGDSLVGKILHKFFGRMAA